MIAGIFVGGQSTRMGGQPKGRLAARDTGEPLIVRSARLVRLAGLTPVLVGEARAYDDLLPDVVRIADAPAGVGPLGGLAGLLAFAQSPLPDPPPEGEGTGPCLPLEGEGTGPCLPLGGEGTGPRPSPEGEGMGHVLVLACDMPFVSLALIHKLAAGPGDEDVLAARGSGGFWEPLCARYRVASCAAQVRAALAARELSLQALLRKLSVAELALSDAERHELCDWDSPEDMQP